MIVYRLLKPFRGKTALQLFLVEISGLSSLEIISQYCITERSIQMEVMHPFVLHAGKSLRAGNGNWYSIREHLRHRAYSRHIQRPLLVYSRLIHPYTLPSAFIRSYLAFRSSAGVGPFGDTGAANARRTGGIGLPVNARFSHIFRISPASCSSSL